jgi:pyruvate,orthophosphate dikinase
MTLGLSRDDAGRFLPDYVKSEKEGGKAIFATDPFVSIDQSGVGKLIKMGIAGGRSTRKHLKVGICGEHGGEAKSVKFCHSVGMNYVSCSPYRVPIARLAAAQAVIEEKAAAKTAAQALAPKAKKAPAKAAAKPEAKTLKAKAKAKPAKTEAKAFEAKAKRGRPAAQKVESLKGSKTLKVAKASAKPAAKAAAKTAAKPVAKVLAKKAAPKKAVAEVKATRGRKPALKAAAPKVALKPVKKPASATPAKRSVGRPKGSTKKS